MKKWFSSNKLYIIGAVAGGLAGFIYWKLVGCTSGRCMITSNPLNSTLYGATIGGLTFGIFKKDNSSVSPSKNNNNDV